MLNWLVEEKDIAPHIAVGGPPSARPSSSYRPATAFAASSPHPRGTHADVPFIARW